MSYSTNYDMFAALSLRTSQTSSSSQYQHKLDSQGNLIISTYAHREYFPFSRWTYCIHFQGTDYSYRVDCEHEPRITSRSRNHLIISLAAICRAVDLIATSVSGESHQDGKPSSVKIYTNSADAISRLCPGSRSYDDEARLPQVARRELQKQIRYSRSHGKARRDVLLSELLVTRIEGKIALWNSNGVKVQVSLATRKEKTQRAYEGAVEEARRGVFVADVREKIKKCRRKSVAKYLGLKFVCRVKIVRIGRKWRCLLEI